ncbi:MAG: sigma-70 family RNA polymerase sigma factor [Bacteroidales bacterium]|nr:sigma-70 family RNA polymerase sigma factor [Bacteroidales bacterium]
MKKTKLTDHELVKQFVDGERSSFEILVNRHKDKVYTYILLMVKNEHLANDIFQETFIKVVKSLNVGKYQENGKFISWVIRIAHNLVIDHFRREKQMRMCSNDEYDCDLFNSQKFSDNTVEEDIISEQIKSDVRKLVDYLPDEQKEVIVLRHFVGLSFKEIAEQTSVSINTALGRMRYALINLRRLIEEHQLNLTVA